MSPCGIRASVRRVSRFIRCTEALTSSRRTPREKLGAIALRTLDEYAPDATALAEALEMDRAIGDRVYEGVRAKLAREPVEDFRIDFEDGYGHRADAEEDGHAAAAAEEVALGCAQGEAPHGIGIRIKPFTEELKARSIRTLDIFLTTLVERMAGELPPGFVVTLPKVTCAEQVAALADLFDVFERSLPLAAGSLKLEIMIESPQAIIDERGSVSADGLRRPERAGAAPPFISAPTITRHRLASRRPISTCSIRPATSHAA